MRVSKDELGRLAGRFRLPPRAHGETVTGRSAGSWRAGAWGDERSAAG
jgi:hypothetical protein